MDPTKSKWFNPNRLNKSVDNKPVDKQSCCITEDVAQPAQPLPDRQQPEKEQQESGNESGNDSREDFLKQLFWLNRHQLSLVPILNSSNLPKKGDRVIIDTPDNDVEWETGVVVRPLIHRMFVRREDVVNWEKGQSLIQKLLEEQLRLIEEMNSVD